jgi:alcohol dehydrogenase
VDVGFEMAGAARAAALAYQAVRRGGTTVVAGLAPPDATLSVPLVGLVADERTLKGSYIGTCVPRRDVPRYIAMYRRGILPVDRLISGVLSLPEINEGFDRLDDGQAVRQIIMMERPLS